MNTNDTKKRNASRGGGGGDDDDDDDDDYCYGEYAIIGSVKILFVFVFV